MIKKSRTRTTQRLPGWEAPTITSHPERSGGDGADCETSVTAAQSKDPVAPLFDTAASLNLPPSATGDYWLYILTNERRTALYIGMTNGLANRLARHLLKEGHSFTSQYQTTLLIYYENYREPADAIAREKQLKRWTRAKKVALISKMNPGFVDLAPVLFGDTWREEVLQQGQREVPPGPSTPRRAAPLSQ